MSLMLHRAASFSPLSLTPPLPFGARLAMIGDSILWAQSPSGEGASGYSNAASLTSIGMWANALSGGRLFLPSFWNQAIGGESSSTIAARFEAALAPVDPDIVLLNAGTNNLSDGAAAILGHFTSMLAIAAAYDWRVIIIPILPRSSNDSTKETTRAAVNAGLAGMASDSVYVADIDFFDYAVQCYPQVSTGERVHPNVIGAKLLANAIRPAITSWVASGNPLVADTDPSSNFFPNGYSTGTGGTTTGATGTLPNGWTFSPDANHGDIDVSFSRIERDAGGHWLQISLSGDYDEGDKAVARYTANLAGAFSEAQRIEISFAIEVDGGAANIDNFHVGLTLFAHDWSAVAFGDSGYLNTTEKNGGADVPAYTGVIRMESLALPPGKVPGNLLLDFIAEPRIDQANGTSVAGTARIGAVSIRVVPAEAPWQMSPPTLAAGGVELSVDRAAAPYRNGAPITGYELRYSTDETNWTTVSMSSDPQTISGLENGTEYFVQTRAINSAGNGPWSDSASATTEWTPAALFANSEDGWWYDITDMATMSQDTAGSAPVTASGQSVGRIADKSGNGHHLVAKDGTTGRPTYTLAAGLHYLAFDGGDYMSAIGVTDVDFVGAAPYISSSGGSFAVPFAFAATNFEGALQRDNATTDYRTGTWLFNHNSGMRINGVATRSYGAANTAHVLTMPKTYASDCPQVRVGGSTPSNDPFVGRLYGVLVGVNRALTTDERDNLEAYIAACCGVAL